jgi:hypothetical protein
LQTDFSLEQFIFNDKETIETDFTAARAAAPTA